MIQDDNGNWISNKEDLENFVFCYYRDLFANFGTFKPFCLKKSFPKLHEEKLSSLGRRVTCEEVHRAIRCMGGFKAPGPDGLQVIFYQSQWSFVGEDLYKLVMDIFYDPKKIEEINDTLITLIPKVDQVSRLKDL